MENNNNTQTTQQPQNTIPAQQPASQPVQQAQPLQQQPAPPPAVQEPQPDPQTGYENLEEKYRKAIDLRLLHYPYRVISKKLIAANFQAAEDTVRKWFSVDGQCHAVYEEMVKVRREELDEQIKHQKDLIERGTANALIIVNKVLEKAVENDEITEQEAIAARDMLDRGGVPKQSKTDGSVKVESEGLNAMAALITGILEGKPIQKPPQQNESNTSTS